MSTAEPSSSMRDRVRLRCHPLPGGERDAAGPQQRMLVITRNRLVTGACQAAVGSQVGSGVLWGHSGPLGTARDRSGPLGTARPRSGARLGHLRPASGWLGCTAGRRGGAAVQQQKNSRKH